MLCPQRRLLWSKLVWTAAAGVLVCGSTLQVAGANTAPAADAQVATKAHATPAAPARARTVRRARHSPYMAAQHAASADIGYALDWGVDSMQAHQTNDGNLIRFTYRIVDTNKAKALIDKVATPMMISPRAGVALQVPVMDKVGALRQSTSIESGRSYWMVFSNKGNLVKPGDHVSVVVGKFRVDGLIVQ